MLPKGALHGRSRTVAVVPLILLFIFGLFPDSLALAHAELVRSEPAANTAAETSPKRIQLWFSEEVDPSFTEAQVLDRNGNRVDAGDSRVLPEDPLSLSLGLWGELPRGTYTVTWRALSAVDGHITRGGFAFAVAEAVAADAMSGARLRTDAPATPSPAAVAARWLSLAGGMLAAGGFFFLVMVWLPAAPRLRSLRDGQSLLDEALGRVRALLVIGLASFALGSLTLLLAQAADLGEGSPELMRAALAQLLLGTRLGAVWLARMALIVMLAAVAVRGIRPGRRLTAASWAGTALSSLALLTFSLTGHGGAVGGQPAVNVLVDWGHVLGAAAWVGGLAHLGALLPLVLGLADRPRRAALGVVLTRFSTVALTGGGVLAASGLYNSVLHVPDLLALSDTLYGNGVLVKLGVLLLLGALGGANLLLVVPRLAVDERSAGAAWWPRFFRGMVAGEITLGALAIAATAVVTSTVPSRQAVTMPAMRPWQEQQRADDLRVGLAISPFASGFSRFGVELRDRRERPVAAERVTLRFTMQEHDMGVQEAPTVATAPGSYLAEGGYLSMTGRWQVEALVRRRGLDDARAVFALQVPALSPGKQAAQAVPVMAVGDAPVVAVELAGLGLLLALAAWRLGGAARWPGVAVLGGAAAVLLAAGFVGAQAQLTSGGTEAVAAVVRNPFPADERSLSIGQQIYQQHCLVCHGATGRGDGPAAAGLRPRPADFEVHLRAGHTDGQLFGWITDAVPGTAMPAFRDRLTEEERWQVLNYMKALVKVTDQ